MRKWITTSVILIGLLTTGCSSTSDTTTSETTSEFEDEFNEIEDENENESSVLHSQGVSCASCHGAGSEESFTSGATVFTTLDAANSDASKYATGYTIRLLLENTDATINYIAGLGSANSYTNASAGTINSYTAQVVDTSGNVVNASAANSHDLTRLDCNRCHSAIGSDGAPGRILAETTTTTTEPTVSASASFSTDVMPVLEMQCQSCHGTSGDFTVTTVDATYLNLTSNSFLNTAVPDDSLLLQKGSGSTFHGGGTVISTASSEYLTIQQWIMQGASNN